MSLLSAFEIIYWLVILPWHMSSILKTNPEDTEQILKHPLFEASTEIKSSGVFNLMQRIKDFLMVATIHGVKYLAAGKNLSRPTWTLLIACSIVGAISLQILPSFNQFHQLYREQDDTKTSITAIQVFLNVTKPLDTILVSKDIFSTQPLLSAQAAT